MNQIFSKLTVTAIIAMDITILPGISLAHGDTPAPQGFAEKAAISHTFEIEAAKLVLDRGKDPAAKSFAADMISDHEQAGVGWQTLQAKSMCSFQRASTTNTVESEALKSSSDQDFDRAYLSTQISAHEEAVSLFEHYAKNSSGGPLKSLAEKTLGTLRTHTVRIHGLTKE
ncbi:DUF4142 domain-containing protein [Pararhizobium qamdonense]|uniref:DUF4142 domain-containing protein n=1 Tax=Pararhizobium qamdonense TaxID=3031126 RepID=UPI0023E2D51D|nr:DUF4142 domain-containing protein [Pararhizobium qamdonense]